jgi:hypothetical protein
MAERFRSHGVRYALVERMGDAAVYSLRYGDNLPIIGYDVVKVQSSTGEQLNALLSSRRGTKIEDYAPDDRIERYPSSSQWGSAAWSFDSLPAAREKYWQLVNQEKQKALEQVSGWRSRKEPSYRI